MTARTTFSGSESHFAGMLLQVLALISFAMAMLA